MKEFYDFVGEHPWITLALGYFALLLCLGVLRSFLYLVQIVRMGYTEDCEHFARKHMCKNCPYKNTDKQESVTSKNRIDNANDRR